MSAAVAESPVAPVTSPVQYVSGLSPTDKEAVFLALLAEARSLGEDAGTLPVDDSAGGRVGYFLTPEAWVRLRELPPIDLPPEEFRRRADAGPDEMLTLGQMNALLDRRAAGRTR